MIETGTIDDLVVIRSMNEPLGINDHLRRV